MPYVWLLCRVLDEFQKPEMAWLWGFSFILSSFLGGETKPKREFWGLKIGENPGRRTAAPREGAETVPNPPLAPQRPAAARWQPRRAAR